jgi:NTP pyrophosphatase (non-canonical NTP hydrolase)
MSDDRLRDLQAMAQQVAELYAARFAAPESAQWTLLKLNEEMGELTGAWLQAEGLGRGAATEQDVADEFADVLGFLLVFAAQAGIDPAKALHAKWGRHLPRKEPGKTTREG